MSCIQIQYDGSDGARRWGFTIFGHGGELLETAQPLEQPAINNALPSSSDMAKQQQTPATSWCVASPPERIRPLIFPLGPRISNYLSYVEYF